MLYNCFIAEVVKNMEHRLMKKQITLFLIIALIITAIPLTATAESSGAPVSLPIIKQTFYAGTANFAIKEDGSLWGWGKNGSGNAFIGNGEIGGPFTPGPDDVLKPIKILDNVKFVGRSAAIKNDNSLWMWGREIDYDNTSDKTKVNTSPVKVMDDVQFVDNWSDRVMVIKTDGSLWVWGANSVSSPLGTGTAENVYTPVKILDNVVQASWGGPSLALTKDGELYAWGLKHFYVNVDGEVYNIAHMLTEKGIERVYSNQAKDENGAWMKPQKVMDGVLSFSNSGNATFIIKADNSLWGWGNNFWGDMSDSVPWRADVDTLHKIMDNVRTVKSGSGTTLAIKTDDTLWSWGSQEIDNFRLGDGLLKPEDGGHIRATPMKIMDNVADVSMDYYHAFALKKDGSLWAWGSGATAGIGDGTHTFRPTPIKVMDGVKLPTAATIQQPPALVAKPTSSTVLVNGKNIAFDAYNINGNNYFKLRDLAFILSGTEKQFEVGWDGVKDAIILTSGETYTVIGGEMTGKGAGDKTPAPTSSKIHLDSKEVQFTAYNIDGNNYFKLRDIGAAFDFGVDWDSANNTIVIDTRKGYTPE